MDLDTISKEGIEAIDENIELENSKKIEASLFITGRYMTIQELVALTDVNPILLKKILRDLQDKYKDSGISIIHRDNTYKMDVSENFVFLVNKLATGSSEFSRAEQETLAMIAYKQPIKQSVIIKIRGNKAYDHIKRFSELGLIHKKRIGHTSELSLTDEFHDYFHVNEKGEEVTGEKTNVES